MADCIAKNIRKRTVRVKESFLETLGKADRTVDEHFLSLHSDFIKQQKNGEKLQKEFRTYVMNMKVANQALRNFYDAVNDVYAQDFHNAEQFKEMTRRNEHFWEQYLRAGDRGLAAMNNYIAEFPPVKVKIGKRGRKLVDYDSARHALVAAQNNSKRTDDKVLKAQDQLEISKKMYEDLNSELLIELPELNEARIPFFLNNMREFFKSSEKFHCENLKVCTTLCNHVEEESLKFSDRIDRFEKLKKARAPNVPTNDGEPTVFGESTPSNKGFAATSLVKNGIDEGYSEIVKKETTKIVYAVPGNEPDVHFSGKDHYIPAFIEENSCEVVNRPSSKDEKPPVQQNTADEGGVRPAALFEDVKNILTKAKDGIVDIFSPPEALYKVHVIHTYISSERDELSLNVGDVISVLPSTSFVDEGWAIGVKEVGGDKGLFPLNFTRRLDAEAPNAGV